MFDFDRQLKLKKSWTVPQIIPALSFKCKMCDGIGAVNLNGGLLFPGQRMMRCDICKGLGYKINQL